MVATSIFFIGIIAVEGALCLIAASRHRLGQHARGDLPGEAPAVLAPAALAFLAAIADDRVPVAVRLFLIVRRDLEGKGLAVLERRAAVETEAGNAQNGELHRQHIALLAARVVTRRLVNSGHLTVREGGGVEARRLVRVLVEPEADRVLWLHLSCAPHAGQGESYFIRAVSRNVCKSWALTECGCQTPGMCVIAPKYVEKFCASGCVERREEQDEAVDRQAHGQPANQQHRLRDRRGPAVGVDAA